MESTKIYYITKYALTKGIIAISENDPAYTVKVTEGGSLLIEGPRNRSLWVYKTGWTHDLEKAQSKIKEKAKRRASSLKKSLEKIARIWTDGAKVVEIDPTA